MGSSNNPTAVSPGITWFSFTQVSFVLQLEWQEAFSLISETIKLIDCRFGVGPSLSDETLLSCQFYRHMNVFGSLKSQP